MSPGQVVPVTSLGKPAAGSLRSLAPRTGKEPATV